MSNTSYQVFMLSYTFYKKFVKITNRKAKIKI